MKKFSLIGSLLLLATVVTFLFIGCQKESAAVADEPVTADAEGAVAKGIDGGNSAISGLISEENAMAMAAAYRKANPNATTMRVGYATKDLLKFITTQSIKYKADSIYVVFGLYDKKTAHTPSKIGFTTVFFMGNKGGSIGGNVRTNADGDQPESNYLNGGSTMNP
jgi:hypothetical protein